MVHAFNSDAPGEVINVFSTSSRTANTDSFDLRQPTEYSRLYFKPTFVDNPSDPASSIAGDLCYERKGKKSPSFPLDEDSSSFSKDDVKNGDALVLHLKAGELHALYLGLQERYDVFESMGGIPYGSASYVQVDNACRTLLALLRRDPSSARMLRDADTFDLVKELVKLLTQGTSHEELHSVLSELEAGNLQELSTGLGLTQLEKVRDDFYKNLSNGQEEYWQKLFAQHQWVLSQIFATPCTLLGERVYVGGKALDNTGGRVCDFIYENKMTKNVSLIEIKTPATPLLGPSYRGGGNTPTTVYSLSQDLSGAVNQVLGYRDSLTKEYNALCRNNPEAFEAFSPECVVVAGTTSMLDAPGKRATFENFRNNLNGVRIITYDELLQRIDDLIAVLSSSSTDFSGPNGSMTAPANTNSSSSSFSIDDIPF